MTHKIIILGAGLTGLVVAHELRKLGIDFTIIEARNRVGGRINTIFSKKNTPVEVGATWFTDHHVNLKALLDQLGLSYFKQSMQGEVLFQSFSNQPAQRLELPESDSSYRITDGSIALCLKLKQSLNLNQIILNSPIKAIEYKNQSFVLTAENNEFSSDFIVSTLPPALLFNSIDFTPNIEGDLVEVAKKTHTWMQDSIRIALVYDSPFWQKKGGCGTIFSNSGPITELYDHSDSQNKRYALGGFVSNAFKNLTQNERLQLILKQLNGLLGNEALNYLAYEEAVWSNEPYTKFKIANDLFPHQNNGHPIFNKDYFNSQFIMAGTETAQHYSGYMEGAVISANNAVKKITEKMSPKSESF